MSRILGLDRRQIREAETMSRYRTIQCLIWHDDKFPYVDDELQLVWFHLKTTPQSTPLGIFYAPIAGLAAEKRWSEDRYRRRLAEGAGMGFWKVDERTHVVYFPNYFKYNRPDNPNVLRGWLKCWAEIPECGLKDECYRTLEAYCREWGEKFVQVLEGMSKRSANVRRTVTVTETVTVTGTVTGDKGAMRPPLPLEAEVEGPKADKTVEAPNAKAKPGTETLFDIYEQENKQLPQLKARSQDRLAKCRSRIDQAARSGCLEQYLKDFRAAVSKAQSTPFLCGDNERGWRADFDWFVANHTNPYRVLEGKYDRVAKTGGDGNGTHQPGGDRPRNPRSVLVYDPERI
jgi:hypothetical protein